jgi:hypothetical protein
MLYGEYPTRGVGDLGRQQAFKEDAKQDDKITRMTEAVFLAQSNRAAISRATGCSEVRQIAATESDFQYR